MYGREADVFVLNSSYEGLPHVVLEAMAAGTPVIATDAGGTAEVVRHGETGLLVKVGDTSGLRQRLNELYADPQRARQLVAGARAMIEREFSFEGMVTATEHLLTRAAGINRAHPVHA